MGRYDVHEETSKFMHGNNGLGKASFNADARCFVPLEAELLPHLSLFLFLLINLFVNKMANKIIRNTPTESVFDHDASPFSCNPQTRHGSVTTPFATLGYSVLSAPYHFAYRLVVSRLNRLSSTALVKL